MRSTKPRAIHRAQYLLSYVTAPVTAPAHYSKGKTVKPLLDPVYVTGFISKRLPAAAAWGMWPSLAYAIDVLGIFSVSDSCLSHGQSYRSFFIKHARRNR
jgi:hypothetical protein